MGMFIGDENDLLRKVKKKMLQEPQNPNDFFEIGDPIFIPQSKTRGIITEFGTDGDIFFETYDRPRGWCVHRTNMDHIIKKTTPRANKKHERMHKFLQTHNKKLMYLTREFLFKNGSEERQLPIGELVFVSEDERFITGLLSKSQYGYVPNQIHVGMGPLYSVFDVIRCFRPKDDQFYYIPKTWLKPHKWNPTIFDNLQLPDKERLYTFVSQTTDFSKYGVSVHKGEGKSLLLYGDIGCGKSMTAEAISNVTKKPIIPVNIERQSAYSAIIEAFQQAEEYNGIVLIDEADLLIADRVSDRVQIDAIQTLLKYLEAFKGIIIFTTNFGQNIDPALMNRIDYKIHYEMTPKIRRQIWKKMLPKKLQGKFDYDKYSQTNINGRDIQKCVMFACRTTDQQNKKKVPVQYIYDEINNIVESKQLEMFDDNTPKKYFG